MVSNKKNKLMKQDRKSNRKSNNKSNRKSNKKSNSKSNRKSNRKLNKQLKNFNNIQKLSVPKYFFNKNDLEQIGKGFLTGSKEKKLINNFKKILKNLETGKSIHTNRIIQDGKLAYLTGSKMFEKFYNENKKNNDKVINFDFYPYLIETNKDLFKDSYIEFQRYSYPKNLVDDYGEIVKLENDGYNLYMQKFNNDAKKSMFYIITSNILIKKLHQYIPIMANESNKYLEIITDTHNAEFSKLGNKSLIDLKPMPSSSMLPSSIPPSSMPLSSMPHQSYNSSMPPPSYNSTSKVPDPFNNIINKLGNNELSKPNKQNGLFPNTFGGNNEKDKDIARKMVNRLKKKVSEPLSIKKNESYTNFVQKTGPIKKKYIPTTYEDFGFDYLKHNEPEYDSSYVEELINKIYHSLREARKFLNMHLIEKSFNNIYLSNKLNTNDENSIISNIHPEQLMEDTKDILKKIKDMIKKHYISDNIDKKIAFTESPYQFIDQSRLSNLGNIYNNPSNFPSSSLQSVF
jgi:hypothetical protein